MSGRTPSPPLNYDYSVVTADTDQSATLLLDAKNEYNKQLCSHLQQPVFNLMKSIYQSSENICHQENTPENILMVFQDNLAQVPKWTKTRRTKEYEEFLKISKCDWFNELIKFTYVTHVKILTIVNKPRPNVKLSISIPSGGAFYHSVCINVARELWRSPFLFSKHVGKYEYQKNMRQIEQIIINCVDTCIRAHIPMKTILQDYLDADLTASTPQSVANTTTTITTTPDSAKIKEPLIAETGKAVSPPLSTDNKEQESTGNTETTLPSNNTKLPINDDIDGFLETPEIANETKSDTEPITKTDTKTDKNPTTIDLEEVDIHPADDIVDELDIIETSIEDKESISADAETYEDLPEVQLSSRTTTPITESPPTASTTLTISEPDTPKTTTQNSPETQSDNIAEFNIDSLPEINLGEIVTTNPVEKPSSPITQISSPSTSITSNTTKQIHISDLNEPGILPELKQPIPVKKQLIVEDLPTDDLDEVNLGLHAEELRTANRISAINQTASATNKPLMMSNKPKDFAFF